jgi:hypothetical protein
MSHAFSLPSAVGTQASGLPLPHSPTKSSIKTQSSQENQKPRLGITISKTSSSQGSQTTLVERGRQQTRRISTFWKEKVHREHILPQSASPDTDSNPTTTLTLSTVILFVFFLAFLSVAANFSIKPVWVSLMIFGIGASLSLPLACILEYRRGEKLQKLDLSMWN